MPAQPAGSVRLDAEAPHEPCSPGTAYAKCLCNCAPQDVRNRERPLGSPHHHLTEKHLQHSKVSPGLIREGQSSSHSLSKQALPRCQAGLNLCQGILGHDVHHVQGRVHQPGQAHSPPRSLPLCSEASVIALLPAAPQG